MIEAKNIHKVYNNGSKNLSVLKGVDLAIEEAKFAAIVGPSGAGKSTLLHILGGLDSPTQGKVFFEGQDLYGLGDTVLSRVRNERIGFVFQFYHLLSEFTVLENILMPALIKLQGTKSQVTDVALKLLKEVGLLERSAHFPNQLSGGEQQRVAIARSLMNKPSLLLCDEPTGNLDTKTGREIINLIRELNEGNRMTVVVVTHNLELAETADKVYHLTDGILES